MLKIAALRDYYLDKAGEAYDRYAARPRILDGQDWRRGPGPDWEEYQRWGAEAGALNMPFERLSGRRWEWRNGGIWDQCWRTP